MSSDSFRQRSVLVTGGTGFIGYHLIARLLREEARVTVLVRRPHDLGRLSEFAGRLRVVQHDLATGFPSAALTANESASEEEEAEEGEVEAPEYVFHLAASGVERPTEDWPGAIASNVAGTANLLQWCSAGRAREDMETNLKAFVYAGTPFEYGPGEGPRREDHALAPTNFYAASKAAGWLLCQAFASMNDLPVVGARPFLAYGPHQGTRRLVPAVVLAALRNGEVKLTGGDQQRDFIFVEDVVDGLLRIARHAGETPEAHGEMFNLGSGEGVTLRAIVARILEIAGSSSRPSFGSLPYRKGELWDLRADVSRARDELGWEAQTSLDQGLRQTIGWYRENLSQFAGAV